MISKMPCNCRTVPAVVFLGTEVRSQEFGVRVSEEGGSWGDDTKPVKE
jgi:hypothetical protein